MRKTKSIFNSLDLLLLLSVICMMIYHIKENDVAVVVLDVFLFLSFLFIYFKFK